MALQSFWISRHNNSTTWISYKIFLSMEKHLRVLSDATYHRIKIFRKMQLYPEIRKITISNRHLNIQRQLVLRSHTCSNDNVIPLDQETHSKESFSNSNSLSTVITIQYGQELLVCECVYGTLGHCEWHVGRPVLSQMATIMIPLQDQVSSL